MNQKSLILIFFTLMLSVTSCSLGEKSYSEEVFQKVKLNSNKIPNGFKQHFNEIRGQLKAGSLKIVTQENEVKNVNASEYVQNHYVHMFDKDIEDVKGIKPDDETAPILKVSLEMFQYVDEIYKTDFPRIAKMIDDGKSDEEINAAIEELDEIKGPIVDEKFNKVHDLIMPYADKHGVEYKILDMPKPVNY
ncbi:hypothetical protein LZQ00_12370 [Sphingobacterium sp. SRCM116780]|uniref:hypothetical protein n=1 Tax=Sphingobacterium sp. SRCM116780 TaxID=2907623 RepID=UPI001F3EB579|nr:hypothetical protein [Sphingobacterium sp. SRCM116780]UIR55074.1 hypothetical protein LZQ00_12370 [Sphingobacterium sp. SRCM116780]